MTDCLQPVYSEELCNTTVVSEVQLDSAADELVHDVAQTHQLLFLPGNRFDSCLLFVLLQFCNLLRSGREMAE